MCPKCDKTHDMGITCCGKCKRVVPRRLHTMATMPLAHVNQQGEPCDAYRWSHRRMGECIMAQVAMFEAMELD